MRDHKPPLPPDPDADLAALLAEAYPVIRRMAAARAQGRSLDATSLAHDALCRVLRSSHPPRDADHLKALTCRAMAFAIMDRYRASGAARRREHQHAVDAARSAESGANGDAAEAVKAALAELDGHAPRKADVFVLSSVAGMTFERIASNLGINERTARRDYDFARDFLAARCATDADGHRRQSANP